MADNANLTECETIVMKTVWDSGRDISLVEIMSIVREKYARDWKRQTVSTFLLHLIQKNYLSSYRVGRVFYYHQLIPLEDYKKAVTKEFVDFWYNGSVEDLAQALK